MPSEHVWKFIKTIRICIFYEVKKSLLDEPCVKHNMHLLAVLALIEPYYININKQQDEDYDIFMMYFLAFSNF